MKGTSSGILSYSFSTHGSACKVFQQGLTIKNPPLKEVDFLKGL